MICNKINVTNPSDSCRDALVPVSTRETRFDNLLFFLLMAWVFRYTWLIRQRPAELFQYVDRQALLQIAIVLLVGLLIAIYYGTKTLRIVSGETTLWWFLYGLFGFVSASWSIYRAFSAYRSVEVIVMSLCVLLAIKNKGNILGIERRTMILGVLVVTMEVTGSLINFGILRDNSYGASAGMLATYSVVILLHSKLKTRRLRLVQQIAIWGTVAVLVSMSLASWWSYLIGICLGWPKNRRYVLSALLLAVFVCVPSLLPDKAIRSLVFRGKSDRSIMSFHGRVTLWKSYWDAHYRHPYVGSGFACGGRALGITYATHTHSSFFGALMGCGWIGVLLLLCFSISCFFRAKSDGMCWYAEKAACRAALVMGMANSLSHAFIGEQWMPPTVVFVAFLGLRARLNSRAIGCCFRLKGVRTSYRGYHP